MEETKIITLIYSILYLDSIEIIFLFLVADYMFYYDILIIINDQAYYIFYL